MQAIILAAGMGRRLGEKTRDNTKCMVEVNGVKLIDRLLGQLAGLDLQRVIIVVGYKGKELREYIESTYLSSLTSKNRIRREPHLRQDQQHLFVVYRQGPAAAGRHIADRE